MHGGEKIKLETTLSQIVLTCEFWADYLIDQTETNNDQECVIPPYPYLGGISLKIRAPIGYIIDGESTFSF